MKCNECQENILMDDLVPHPCDRTSQVLICKECAIVIESSYEFKEIISGRITQERESCL